MSFKIPGFIKSVGQLGKKLAERYKAQKNRKAEAEFQDRMHRPHPDSGTPFPAGRPIPVRAR